MNDVVANKIQGLQRCVQRAREEYKADPDSFATNYTRQDAALLNVTRACEMAIDLANHIVRTYQLGIPTSSADSFRLLQAQQIIDDQLAKRMQKMIGFRNLVVHQYSSIDIQIVIAVITTELDELLAFGEIIRQYIEKTG